MSIFIFRFLQKSFDYFTAVQVSAIRNHKGFQFRTCLAVPLTYGAATARKRTKQITPIHAQTSAITGGYRSHCAYVFIRSRLPSGERSIPVDGGNARLSVVSRAGRYVRTICS